MKIIVFILGSLTCIICAVFIYFAKPSIESYIERNREHKSITVGCYGGWSESWEINKLLDNGWRLVYTTVDGCGTLRLDFVR